jgi:hypothetical protein
MRERYEVLATPLSQTLCNGEIVVGESIGSKLQWVQTAEVYVSIDLHSTIKNVSAYS